MSGWLVRVGIAVGVGEAWPGSPVGVGVALAVALGWPVGVPVAVGLAPGVPLGVGLAVDSLSSGVGELVGVDTWEVGSGVDDDTGVRLGYGVKVASGMGVPVRLGSGVWVGNTRVLVTLGKAVRVSSAGELAVEGGGPNVRVGTMITIGLCTGGGATDGVGVGKPGNVGPQAMAARANATQPTSTGHTLDLRWAARARSKAPTLAKGRNPSQG